MTTAVVISLVVNGERIEASVLPRLNLADFLREHLKLTGTHVGCEHGVCGACTVRIDGDIVRSCLMLAVQTHGAAVETIEGVSDNGEVADLQSAFRDAQCIAMRVLHAGNADGCAGSVEAIAVAGSRTDSRAPFRQLLPLYRLPGHRRCRRGDSACAQRALVMTVHGKPKSAFGAGPAELLYRQDGAAAEPRPADAGAWPLCQRH